MGSARIGLHVVCGVQYYVRVIGLRVYVCTHVHNRVNERMKYNQHASNILCKTDTHKHFLIFKSATHSYLVNNVRDILKAVPNI